MKLYRVDVYQTRSSHYYIAGPDRDAVEDDVKIMASDIVDGALPEYDWHIREADPAKLQEFEMLWSGGPDGEDLTLKQWLQARAEASTAKGNADA